MFARRLLVFAPVFLTGALLVAAESDADRILRLFRDEFVSLTPGKGAHPAAFRLGSSEKDAPATEKPTVEVRLPGPFAIAKYEVTQELYQLVMGKNPSRWKGPRNSVEMTTWDDANTFCQKVTGMMRKAKLLAADEEIRLPTEAEWEYACRAGTTTRYSFGDNVGDLGTYCWFTGNAKGNDPPVGAKKPNPWGLYDMHGYVWEWCADAWHPDHTGASATGAARVKKDEAKRVLRGGAWTSKADQTRSAARMAGDRSLRGPDVGFRCVRARVGAP